MRFFRSRKDSLKFWLSFFFVAGSIGGSVFCNEISDGMKAELLQVEKHAVTSAVLANVDYKRLFMAILWKKIRSYAVLLLMLAAPMAEGLRMATVLYWGFSVAMMVCPLTMDVGIGGIWNYLCLNTPQGMFYLTAWYLLLWWMPMEDKRLTVGGICAIGVLLLAGVVAETYINPYFLPFLFKN